MHISDLPPEILLHILSYLSPDQLYQVKDVCLKWQSAFKTCLSRVKILQSTWPDKIYTNESLQMLLPHMPALRTINIANKEKARLDLELVSRHCRQLAEIDLSSFRVTVDGLHRLCLFCPRLQVVTMYSSDAACVEVVLSHQPQLRKLTLLQPRIDRDSDRGLACLSCLPASLEWLHISDWHRYSFELRSDDVIRLLSRCERLRVLELENVSRLQATGLRPVLNSCRRLERRSLRGSPVWGQDSLRPLAACANLLELDLSELQRVQPAELAAGLAGCVRLERLTAAALSSHPLEQCLPRDGLPTLRHLSVPHSLAPAVTDDTLERLRVLAPGLQSLDVSFCRSLTEPGLRQLSRLLELRALLVAGVPAISDSLLSCMLPPRLVSLELGRSDTFAELVSMGAVTRLVLLCSELRRLTLFDNLTRVRCLVEELTPLLDADRAVTLVLYPGFPQRLSALATEQLRIIDTAAARCCP